MEMTQENSNSPQRAHDKAEKTRRTSGWPYYGIIVLVAIWMFVLGVLTGRGTAPLTYNIPDIYQKVEYMLAAALHREREALGPLASADENSEDLAFFEALRTEEPGEELVLPEVTDRTWYDAAPTLLSSGEITAPAPQVAASVPADPQPAPKHVTQPEPASTPAATPAEPIPAVTEEKPPPTPSVTPKAPALPPPAGPFTIQIAALKELQAATDLVNTLRDRGYQAYHDRSTGDSQGYYRVRVGVFEEYSIATLVQTSLEKDSFSGRIVPH